LSSSREILIMASSFYNIFFLYSYRCKGDVADVILLGLSTQFCQTIFRIFFNALWNEHKYI